MVLLGTGSPLPSANRCGAGQVILAGDARVLVDSGWGTARRHFPAGVLPATIDTVCFTHMHSDHITDLPDFLIMRWTGGATRPLTVYGPEGTRETVAGFLAGLARDIGYRLAHHGDKLSTDCIRCIVHEVPATPDCRPVAEVDGLMIEAFEVDHFPVVPAFGFRFAHAGRRLVVSGDTRACDSLVQASDGADLLVCEAMNVPMLRGMIDTLHADGNAHTAGMLDDAITYHAPTLDVATMARDAGVKQIVLSHLIPAVPDDGPRTDSFIAGMSDIYQGPITVGRDLLRLSV